ncbi:FAD binding domain-containing protein [Sodiomyces alkalinus F11]|uniref:assimilatory sulfite reductase (NADPH) n=1 Tax=Sodiomyces alkalinus (strain CBS 110278 / VKM F-3762 / F11) TaxID=1314773 RepID=A0A3N2PNV7_SODAK|nr:FAD binding domain-containing protein [Sodiomyces alkalinus F11]ROT36211.1 FAD binding domain-containing protein [Sodiomyces alkalinus F11]
MQVTWQFILESLLLQLPRFDFDKEYAPYLALCLLVALLGLLFTSRLPRFSSNPTLGNHLTSIMQFKPQESAGAGAAVLDSKPQPASDNNNNKSSSALPFGQHVALSSISGPTYVTAQLLVQQVAYLLSDKIFSYSAPTFDLDVAARAWAEAKERNIRGQHTDVIQLQTRTGAGALALGYIFSPDFDMSKRHVPQSLLAPSLSLKNLRGALDQLSLLYGVASPFVAHVAALDYDAQNGLLSEYDTALRTAEELGLGLVSSSTAAEAQHMALFATLMAAVLPTLHVYDGVRLARETSRIVDALSKSGIADLYNTLTQGSPAAEERQAISSKVVNLLNLVSKELGSDEDAESNHTALLATLMTALTPTLGVEEGVRLARETMKASSALNKKGVTETYKKISKEVTYLNKRLDDAGKVMELLKLFNSELGTAYDLFEYHGHRDAETVLVAFGSVEAQIAKQVVARLAADGAKVGAINVRVYRPFVEEAFLDAIPAAARRIAVLGQVRDEAAIEDVSLQSALYADVLAAVSFSGKWAQSPVVADVKYAASVALTPQAVADIFTKLEDKDAAIKPFPLLVEAQQYTFWDVDSSVLAQSPAVVGKLLACESAKSVYVDETFDNLIQGGALRTDIRSSRKAIDAPYAVEEGDVVAVGDEKLLKEVDIIRSVKQGGKVLLKLPNFKEEDLEKRIPAFVCKSIVDKGVELFVFDTSQSAAFEEDPAATKALFEFAFLKLARPDISVQDVAQATLKDGATPSLQETLDALEVAVRKLDIPAAATELPVDFVWPALPVNLTANSFVPFDQSESEAEVGGKLLDWQAAAKGLAFKEAYGTQSNLRPELSVKTHTVTVKENRRLTPGTYDRNIFHIEFDLGDSGVTYKIGEALGIHAENDDEQVQAFIAWYGLNPDEVVQVPSREDPTVLDTRTVYQGLKQNIDVLGKPPKRFYEALAEFATNEAEKKKLAALGGPDGAAEFKKRSEGDTVTYVDILQEFPSARPSFHDLVRIVAPLKRREYSIASAQAVTPNAVALMIVVVDWVDTRGRTRWGHASRYLSRLPVGAKVTVSVKPSVMKLPASPKAPLIMAGLGTGLAPFRAFVQYRALQKARGEDIGPILLYLGSRHQREEYLYGEEWEAYLDAGVITLLGAAFSRDQPQKIYIQDRMRQTMKDIVQAYVRDSGSFYLCGPTWPVPDVTDVLKEAIEYEARLTGKKVNARNEIEKLKEEGRYVLEVY